MASRALQAGASPPRRSKRALGRPKRAPKRPLRSPRGLQKALEMLPRASYEAPQDETTARLPFILKGGQTFFKAPSTSEHVKSSERQGSQQRTVTWKAPHQGSQRADAGLETKWQACQEVG